MLRIFLTIQISIIVLAVYCQDVTVINQYEGLGKDENLEHYVLKNVTEHRYIINEYELVNTGIRSQVEQMISYGLRAYIDNSYHIYDGRVEAITGDNDFLNGARNIVRNAVWIHDESFGEEFNGFSKYIAERVDRVLATDGYLVLGGSNDNKLEEDGEVGLYTFQRMVFDLKKACELEVSFFLDKHLPRATTTTTQDGDDHNLETKTYRMKPSGYNINDLINDKPNFDKLFPEDTDTDTESDSKRRKRTKNNKSGNELTERVVELLEQNSKILNSYNDRFENLQQQIDDVRSNSNSEIKDEIADLRTMIEGLSKGEVVKESDGSTTSILPKAPVVIIFEKNVYELSLSQKAILNKALMVLRQNTEASALITGFADKTGNAELNAWISKKRAEEVQSYLIAQGIDENRLIINFLGDAESESPNPLDRKVSVNFLVNNK